MSEIADSRRGFAKGNKGERPECCEEAHLKFLDDLRESGDTNMFAARPYLMDEFDDLSAGEAAAILGYWMKTFEERHPSGQ